MYLNNIEIEADEGYEIPAEIIEGISFLLQTNTGTYPMNRDFGIDQDLLDEPLNTMRPLLAIEIKDKIEKYEPRVEVDDVDFRYDEETKTLIPIISLSPSGYEEEEDEEEYDDEEDDV